MSSVMLAAVLALGAALHPAGAAENDYIAVTGSGEAEQWPDYGVVRATAWALEPTPKAAIAETTQTLRALAANLKKTGIPDERIEFLPPQVERQEKRVQQEDGEYRDVTAGFTAVQDIQVTVRDPGRVGDIVKVLTDGGAQITRDIAFQLDDPGDLRKRARTLAMTDARTKAQDLARGAQRRLGKVLVVEESRISGARLFPTLRQDVTGLGPHRHRQLSGALHSPSTPVVTPQPVSESVRLYVKFALE